MKSQRTGNSVLWAGFVFAIAFVVQMLGMTRAITLHDEGIELFGAVRVLHGDLPYRDFLSEYGPGQIYTMAGLFKLFGASVLVGRVYHCFSGACVTAFVFLLVKRITGRTLALFAAGLALLWLTGIFTQSYDFPTYPALALILASTYFLLPLLRDDTSFIAIAMSGACAGLVTLFRHDLGFYTFICELAMILSRSMAGAGPWTGLRRLIVRNIRQAAIYAFATSLIVVPCAVLLLTHVPLHDLYFDLIYYPARIYPVTRALPFPHFAYLLDALTHKNWDHLEEAIDYFPGLVSFTSIVYLALTRRSWREQPGNLSSRRLHVLLTVLLLMMTFKGLIRVSPIQLIQAILLAMAVLVIVLHQVRATHQRLIRVPMVILVGCCFAAAAFPAPAVGRDLLRRSYANTKNMFASQADDYAGGPGGLFKDSCRVPDNLRRMRCFYLDPNEVQAIAYIQAHTNPGDRIYVGAGHHDRINSGDVSFYFVSQRLSATKWHQLDPGIQTTRAIQTEMVADLKRSANRYVVLNSVADQVKEENQSMVSSGVTILDDYIRSNYQKVGEFGTITIFALNPSMSSTPT